MNEYSVLGSWFKNTAEDLGAPWPVGFVRDARMDKHSRARRLWEGEACRGEQRGAAAHPDSTLRCCTPEVGDTPSSASQRRGENFQRLSSSASPQYMPAHGDVFSARLCVAGSIPLGCVEPV